MIKIGVTSDNHLDVNRLDATLILEQQAAYLKANKFDYYLIAGDQFNDFRKTQTFVTQLNDRLHGQTQVYFIAGNHDMVNGLTYPELQQAIMPAYLHQKYVDMPGTDYRIIGNNGWYDYSFATNLPKVTAAEFSRWRNAYWIDGGIKGRGEDLAMMQAVLNNVHQQLNAAQQTHKKVLFMTHFVPQPAFIFFSLDRRYWNMANALMGSAHLGQLLEAYQVPHVFFGHLHVRHQPTTINGVTYHMAPVGYGLKRLHEWVSQDFMTEWRNTLQIIEIWACILFHFFVLYLSRIIK